MTYKNPQKFDLKIRLYNQEKSFGKGVYELMKKTQSFGSLSCKQSFSLESTA